MKQYAPLPHEWMLVSILGFFISILEVWPRWSKTWGFAFAVLFGVIFIASFINMDAAGLNEEELHELAIHKKEVLGLRHRK